MTTDTFYDSQGRPQSIFATQEMVLRVSPVAHRGESRTTEDTSELESALHYTCSHWAGLTRELVTRVNSWSPEGWGGRIQKSPKN